MMNSLVLLASLITLSASADTYRQVAAKYKCSAAITGNSTVYLLKFTVGLRDGKIVAYKYSDMNASDSSAFSVLNTSIKGEFNQSIDLESKLVPMSDGECNYVFENSTLKMPSCGTGGSEVPMGYNDQCVKL